MQLNIKEFLEEAEISEAFYPGKRLVHTCRQEGEYKSHCVVLDWRDPDTIRIEIKAGLSGRNLDVKKLKYYPISFQAPTYVDIEVVNDNEDDIEEEEEESKGKGGKGGTSKGQKKSLKDMKDVAMAAFGDIVEKAAPELGKIKEMMVMGKEIAADKYGQVIGELANQIEHGKIIATELLSKAADVVTKYEPPSFMQAKGNETAKYSYDREKNADIGFQRTISAPQAS